MGQKRILLIGRRQEVLDKLSGVLTQEGFIVQTTHDIEGLLEKPDEEKLLVSFDCEIPDDLHIYFSMKENCNVLAELFYFDYANGQTYQKNLLLGSVEKGEHTFTTEKNSLRQGLNFIVMKINEEELFLHKFIVDSEEKH
jgi:hypothetical protein